MLAFLILFLIVLGAYVIIKYNGIITLKNNRERAFADIDVQLKLRFDLVPNLVNTVKGYAAYEKSTFEEITRARSKYQEAKTTDDKIIANNMLSSALNGLNITVENYPDLKANQSFLNLQTELSDIENKIAASRRFFNGCTNEYNTFIEQFPANMIASIFNFQTAQMFKIENEAEKINPEVIF